MLTLSLLAPLAHACDHVALHAPGVDVHVDECDGSQEAPEAPPAAIVGEADDDRQHLQLQYGMQFLPEVPGHDVSARLVGERDAYLMGELRYTPGSEVVGVGRVSAGLDAFGRSDFDLTLGLFIGTAGEWDRQVDRAVLYAAPIGGTELGVGYEGGRFLARYRWLAGFGAGPVREMLTENELTIGYRFLPRVHAIGQFVALSPGELEDESGVGIGVRVEL